MALKTSAYLRRADREDLDTVVEWMGDPDFLHFLYGDRARSPKQIREQIVGMLGRTAGNTMPGGIYFIIDSQDHGPIGLVSLQNISWRNRSCSVDVYMGNKSLRSSFVAGISFYRAAEYCFDELNMHRVGAYIYAFNPASWRLMEKTGATREIVMHQHVPRDGQLHDLYGYGLLRSEWEQLRESMAKTFEGMSLHSMVQQRKDANAGESEPAPAATEAAPQNGPETPR